MKRHPDVFILNWKPIGNGKFLVTCEELPEVSAIAETEDAVDSVGLAAIKQARAARKAKGEPEP